MSSTFRLSLVTQPLVASLVGFFGSVAIVLSAANALHATEPETVSWITGICLAMGVSGIALSLWHRIPIITAWSTPGAALIAASGGTVTVPHAVGAFVLTALLILTTAAIRPLGRLIEAIPPGIASAMLAGVLLKFVTPMFDSASTMPWLVLPLLAFFLLTRLIRPALAVIAVLIGGVLLARALGLMHWTGSATPFGHLLPVSTSLGDLPRLVDATTLIGLGLPLYLVTMASQYLPGAAVLKAAGYKAPMTSILSVTGLVSLLTAPFGAHITNLGAIVAALCTGPETHPDPARRWPAGVVYGILFLGLAAFAGWFVAVFRAMPPELIRTIAGLALLSPLTGSIAGAVADEKSRFPAILTFGVTASSLLLFGINSAFWGLLAGMIAYAAERLRDGRRA